MRCPGTGRITSVPANSVRRGIVKKIREKVRKIGGSRPLEEGLGACLRLPEKMNA